MRVQADATTQQENETPAALVQSVASILTLLVQALRSMQLYGPTNPTSTRSLDSLRTAFERVWEQVPEIELHLTPDTMLLGGKPVYENSNHSDSLAFLMFRDGVRLLVFRPGFETEELPVFMQTLHRARYQPSESDDLITLLWDGDFVNFLYGYIDAEAAAGDDAEVPTDERVVAAVTASRNLTLKIHDASARAVAEANYPTNTDASTADPPAMPGLDQGLQGASLQLEPETFVYLQHELEEEVRRDLRRDVLAALLDSLEDSEPRAQSEILEILGGFLARLVTERCLSLAADALNDLNAFADGQALDELRRREIEAVLNELAASEPIQELIAALETGDLQGDPSSIEAIVTILGPTLLPNLLRAREKSGNKELRAALESACEELVRRHPDVLAAQLQSKDLHVVRAALSMQRSLGRTDLLAETIRNVEHSDQRVRLAAVEVLVSLGGDASLASLVARLTDDNRAVRVAACWGLMTWKHQAALGPLAAAIDAKEYREVDSEERMAMLDAYAQIGGASAVERISRLLLGRTLLKPRERSEVRSCAARALGLTGSPEAKALLERCAEDGDPEVKRAVQRALRRIAS